MTDSQILLPGCSSATTTKAFQPRHQRTARSAGCADRVRLREKCHTADRWSARDGSVGRAAERMPMATSCVDLEGRTTPRYTTIYDAARQALRRANRRRRENSDPDSVPSAAHEAGRGLPVVRRADLRPETRPARRRAQTSSGLSASGEGWDGSLHDERDGPRWRSRTADGESHDRNSGGRSFEAGDLRSWRKNSRSSMSSAR